MEPRRLQTQEGEIIYLYHILLSIGTQAKASLWQRNYRTGGFCSFQLLLQGLPLNTHVTNSWQLRCSSTILDS